MWQCTRVWQAGAGPTQAQDLQGAQRQRALGLALAAASAAPVLCLDRLAQVRGYELAAGTKAPSPAAWRRCTGVAQIVDKEDWWMMGNRSEITS